MLFRSALALLAEAGVAGRTVDAAIIDMHMPEMDGLALGHAMKADARSAGIPLILLTSGAKRGDAAQARACGFSAFLTKPVKSAHLRQCLATALGQVEEPSTTREPPLITRHTLAEQAARRRILVAEDNLTNQKVVMLMLQRLGYRADVVGDGQQAVRALESIPYDLVLMDCQMPEMDGYKATRVIRSPESRVPNHDIPIVALTAGATKEDRERALSAGMNDFLSKPIDNELLASTLARWLAPPPAQVEPAPPDSAGGKAEEQTNASPAPSPTTFDRAGALARFADDAALLREIVESFIGEAPKDLERLRTALAASEPEDARRHAHSIKGAAANVGALAVVELAARMEQAARETALEQVTAAIPELERRLKEFSTETDQSLPPR